MNIFVRSNGCARRQAEAARTRLWAQREGMTETGPEDADMIVVHTCVVNRDRVDQTEAMLTEYAATGARLIVAGCAPQARPDCVPDSAESIPLGRLPDALPGIENIRSSAACRCVQVASGCLGSCAYCITRSATGTLRSRHADDIAAEIDSMPDSEILLAAEDVLAWGRDKGDCLADLLNALPQRSYCLDNGSPQWMPDQAERLVGYCRSGKIWSMTVSVQSFAPSLLERMGRDYNPDVVLPILQELNEVTDLNLHMMVGFDGETEDEFQQSMASLRTLPRVGINVFRYHPHNLPQYGEPVPEDTKMQRWQDMTAVTRPRANNRGYCECRK